MNDHAETALERLLSQIHDLGHVIQIVSLKSVRLSHLVKKPGNRESKLSKELIELKEVLDELSKDLHEFYESCSDVRRAALDSLPRGLPDEHASGLPTEDPIKILWVDDDALHLNNFRGQFEDAKMHMSIADTVTKALSLVNSQSFDAALIDLMMPPDLFSMEETAAGSLTGLALARRIRKKHPSMPIIFFTVARSREATAWCVDNPPATILFKPEVSLTVVTKIVDLVKGRNTKLDRLESLLERFPVFLRALASRHADRPKFQITDEYDIQDLLRAVLFLNVDDIREEEWSPSYAGASSRIDFVLTTQQTAIEVKMTRPHMSLRQLGDQLLVDIARYKKHPDVKALVCFIVDAAEIVTNRAGLIKDFRNSSSSELEVRAVVCSIGRLTRQ